MKAITSERHIINITFFAKEGRKMKMKVGKKRYNGFCKYNVAAAFVFKMNFCRIISYN